MAHFENELRSEKTELAKSTEILRANEQTAKKLNETTISLEEISERYQLLNQDSERLTEELRRMIELNAILAN